MQPVQRISILGAGLPCAAANSTANLGGDLRLRLVPGKLLIGFTLPCQHLLMRLPRGPHGSPELHGQTVDQAPLNADAP